MKPRLYVSLLAVLVLVLALPAAARPPAAIKRLKPAEDRMSEMGRLAARARAAIERTGGRQSVAEKSVGCVNTRRCPGEGGAVMDAQDDLDSVRGGQAEVSIAVDSTGQHVVVGYNDTRGFSLNPLSVSGYLYSDDGGVTFVDGGQLPSPGTDLIGTTRLPQVLGDPEIKYMGGCNFIYASIAVAKFSATRAVQTMGVHRSTDCGHTWTGPFIVPPASNPNGAVTGSGSPVDAADKEFMDVDPETGRVILTWSNFTSGAFAPGGLEISSTYSDDILTGNPPTWSPRQVISETADDGQSSVPRFAGNGSNNAYAVWRRFPFPGTFLGLGNTIAFARSTDNGATWSAPVNTSAEFFTMDQVLGNDRVNTSPTLAVDNSGGPYAGTVYVAYANNNNQDGADVVVQRSTDGGLTFSAPLRVNSRPGNDRAQWFPWVTIDQTTGRVYLYYYDQGIAATGDLTETTVTYSDDGGVHWSPPVPLSDRPFQAGWGNDTGQPNLGDYNQAVAQDGELFAAFAYTFPPTLGFTDGQPTGNMDVPEIFFRRVPQPKNDGQGAGDHPPANAASRATNSVPLALAGVSFTDSGGNGYIDPGETVNLRLTLRNYVTNPLSADKVLGTTAVLSTATPGVTVVQDQSPYANMNPGSTAVNTQDFVLQIGPGFVPGTPIELVLDARSNQHGAATLLYRLFTGTPVATTLFAENFNGVAPGTLPAGWAVSHGGGVNTVPWTTNSTFCGTASNAAFHINANDGPGGANTRFERLFSPLVTVPATSEYVVVEFDVCYDTEEDPNLNIQAYDGFLVRVTDQTPGRFLRSVLVEAFADEFTTGSIQHHPKHFPRNSNANYFQDMSAWAGYSNGFQHVRMRLPGMAGSVMQLRFEYTQDSTSICSDIRPGHSCGVMVDNVVIKNVVSAP
ncbi:MAG TPA: exo-alpha-sialidase [Thermoanaerobaculia bacterium]